MKTSVEIGELAAALALAQGEIAAAPKDSINSHFKNRYADLAACWGAARLPLSKHGLSVTQDPQTNVETVVVTVVTRIIHKSGQWLENELCCRAVSARAQDVGAATTYLKRYGFCAMVGVVADEDDDGNKASGREDKGKLQEKREERQQAAGEQRDAKRKAGVFEGSAEQEKIIAAILEKRGVPREFWDEIRKSLMGKKSTDLDAVIEAVRQGSIDAQGFQADLDRTF